MPPNLFDQLKQIDVPPVPPRLEQKVHQRLNKRLVLVHVVEFAFRVLPYALAHFAAAVGGLVWLSLSGKFPPAREKPRDRKGSAGD